MSNRLRISTIHSLYGTVGRVFMCNGSMPLDAVIEQTAPNTYSITWYVPSSEIIVGNDRGINGASKYELV
jgi:hypothetical protein